eukprot:COSAG02_NODE_5509_length_4270_cov_34.130424_1_plen_60_part_00
MNSMAALVQRLIFIAALCWLPSDVLRLQELEDKTIQPDGRPPLAFSAARHKTPAELEKV